MQSIRRRLPYLLAGVCLIAAGLHVADAYAGFDLSSDMVSPWEEHMKLIRAALPQDVFVVGYVDASNVPNSGSIHDSAEFFMTQYGVAPIVIVVGLEHEWIIGNFGNRLSLEDVTPWLDQAIGNHAIQHMGFGVYLIHDLPD